MLRMTSIDSGIEAESESNDATETTIPTPTSIFSNNNNLSIIPITCNNNNNNNNNNNALSNINTSTSNNNNNEGPWWVQNNLLFTPPTSCVFNSPSTSTNSSTTSPFHINLDETPNCVLTGFNDGRAPERLFNNLARAHLFARITQSYPRCEIRNTCPGAPSTSGIRDSAEKIFKHYARNHKMLQMNFENQNDLPSSSASTSSSCNFNEGPVARETLFNEIANHYLNYPQLPENFNVDDNNSRSPLFRRKRYIRAIRSGDLASIKFYKTPYSRAKFLIEKSFHDAALTNNSEKLLRMIQRGHDPDMSDSLKRTALHKASSKGYTDCVKVLLDNGANPNLKDNVGNTPLHLAALSNHISIITLLLKHGCDASSTDLCGRSPLQLAQSRLRVLAKSKYSNSCSHLKSEIIKVIDMLLLYFEQKNKKNQQIKSYIKPAQLLLNKQNCGDKYNNIQNGDNNQNQNGVYKENGDNNNLNCSDLEFLNLFQTRMKLSENVEEDLTDLLNNLDQLSIANENNKNNNC